MPCQPLFAFFALFAFLGLLALRAAGFLRENVWSHETNRYKKNERNALSLIPHCSLLPRCYF
jgi:hypothetical protein